MIAIEFARRLPGAQALADWKKETAALGQPRPLSMQTKPVMNWKEKPRGGERGSLLRFRGSPSRSFRAVLAANFGVGACYGLCSHGKCRIRVSEIARFFAKICSIRVNFCVSKTPLNIFAIRELTFRRAKARVRYIFYRSTSITYPQPALLTVPQSACAKLVQDRKAASPRQNAAKLR